MLRKAGLFLCLTSILFSPTPGANAGGFLAARTYSTGQLPAAAVVQDFNHDGLADLATANEGDNNISVLLGRVGGDFAPSTNYVAGDEPFGIAAGDLNGDGNVDLAVTNTAGNSVSLFQGNGDGTFGGAGSIAVQTLPRGLIIADLNHDNNLDLAVAIRGLSLAGEGWVAVMLGMGNGSFQNAVLYPAGQNPLHLAAADLNGDGDLDLAVADENATSSPNDLAILLGNGDGTFPAPLLSRVTGTSSDLAVTNLNPDGIPDLVVAGGNGNTVSVRLGNGDGTFHAAVEYATPAAALTIALADLNTDGRSDLLVGGSNGVNVLLGRSGGTFREPIAFGVGTRFVVTGDFNQDQAVDAVARGDLFSVSVAFGNGDGTFAAARVYSAGTMIKAVTTGDFNRDGGLDLALAKEPANTLSILLGTRSGDFGQGAEFGSITPSDVIAADFNRDSKLDLSVTSSAVSGSGANLYLGNGDGTFGLPQNFNPGAAPLSQVAADFDRDGRLDLATANDASEDISVLLGNGDGTFQAPVNYPAHRHPNVILAADFNRDGDLDLAVNNSASARVGVYLGNGDGTFQAPLELITVGTTMVSGDFNRDKNLDLIVGGNPRLYLGNGDGTFQAAQAISFEDGDMQAADINGDGRLDFVLASKQVHVMLGNGDGTFQTGVDYFSGALLRGTLEVADVNRDGAPDVMVTDSLENISVLLNTGGIQVTLTSSLNPSFEGDPVTFTATVAPTFPEIGNPRGRIKFMDGKTPIGITRLAGGSANLTTSTLTVGQHKISAIYSGDQNFNQSASMALAQVVNPP